MPIYEYQCPKCEKNFELILSIKDADTSIVECESCLIEAKRVILTAPGVNIPYHMQASPNMTKKSQARVPINIIDEKPDGGYRVTRIGRKTDIENN